MSEQHSKHVSLALTVVGSVALGGLLAALALRSRYSSGSNKEKKFQNRVLIVDESDSDPITKLSFGEETRSSLFHLKGAHSCFLNHGSYGAVPLMVSRAQQRLMQHVEENPDGWYRRESYQAQRDTISKIATFVGANADDMVFVVNATTATTSVIRSLCNKGTVGKGDVVLCTSFCYNACINALRAECERVGAELVMLEIPLPVRSADHILQAIEKSLDDNKTCKFAFFDHISSATAMVFPVKEIARACRKRGVKLMIDGAHAVGQLALNLNDLDCDYYTSNFHKWLFSPKGSAFLWVRKDCQDIEPTVTSHEWKSGFLKSFWMQATRDETAFIATGEALRFIELIGWSRMDTYRRKLLQSAVNLMIERFNKTISGYSSGPDPLLCPAGMNVYMTTIRLPFKDSVDKLTAVAPNYSAKANDLLRDLLENYHIVLPVWSFQGYLWCRISSQIYNHEMEYLRCAEVIETLWRANKY